MNPGHILLDLSARAGGGHSHSSHHSSSGGGGSSHISHFGGTGTHYYGGTGGGHGGGGGIGGIIAVVVIAAVVIGLIAFTRLRRNRKRAAAMAGGGGHGHGGSSLPPMPSGGEEGGSARAGEAGWAAAGGQKADGSAGAVAGGWSHDDRPAIESVRGTLFPGSVDPLTGAGGGPESAPMSTGEGVAAITAHDPAFSLEAFIEQAQRAFFVVQEAWTDRKPEMSRQVMADGLWQQHRVQIKGYTDEHKRNIMGDLMVSNMDVINAHSDQSYDTIVLRVRAACSDYDVNDDGKVIRGNKKVEEWAEDWTFQRSSKATTSDHGGTLSQKCPNCGAPLNVDLAGVCPYCKAPVMSGEYDWVLARISQLG